MVLGAVILEIFAGSVAGSATLLCSGEVKYSQDANQRKVAVYNRIISAGRGEVAKEMGKITRVQINRNSGKSESTKLEFR